MTAASRPTSMEVKTCFSFSIINDRMRFVITLYPPPSQNITLIPSRTTTSAASSGNCGEATTRCVFIIPYRLFSCCRSRINLPFVKGSVELKIRPHDFPRMLPQVTTTTTTTPLPPYAADLGPDETIPEDP